MGGSMKRQYDPICVVATCDKNHHTKGYCQGHWGRLERGLDPHNGPPLGKGKGKYLNVICAASDCERGARSKGYCQLHYRRSYEGLPLGLPYNCATYSKLWKDIKYITAHKRCRDMWGSAKGYLCVFCGDPAREWAYDGTDPTELYETPNNTLSKAKYSRFPEFYMPLCLKCHRQSDKTLAAQELEEYRDWKHRTGLTVRDLPQTRDGCENLLGESRIL